MGKTLTFSTLFSPIRDKKKDKKKFVNSKLSLLVWGEKMDVSYLQRQTQPPQPFPTSSLKLLKTPVFSMNTNNFTSNK